MSTCSHYEHKVLFALVYRPFYVVLDDVMSYIKLTTTPLRVERNILKFIQHCRLLWYMYWVRTVYLSE